jgi:hypothetical protein
MKIDPQGFAWARFGGLGIDGVEQACRHLGRVRVQAWRQYAGYPSLTLRLTEAAQAIGAQSSGG